MHQLHNRVAVVPCDMRGCREFFGELGADEFWGVVEDGSLASLTDKEQVAALVERAGASGKLLQLSLATREFSPKVAAWAATCVCGGPPHVCASRVR